jgi:deoxyribodipyrimidine photo-lyase
MTPDRVRFLLQVMWGGTLFHVEDLPFQLPSMPPHYSDFRRAVRSLAVRAPVETPAQVKALPAAS